MPSKLLFIVATAALVSAPAAWAAAKTTIDPANLRSGPGLAWPVIGRVPASGEVHILTCGQGNTRGWCQVRYGDQKGWLAASTLAPSGRWGVKVAPLATRYSVHMRSQPTPSAGVVGVIPPQTVVSVNDCMKGWHGGWCHVTYEGKSGYIRQSLLGRRNAVIR
jgi:uncharacterized protein YraI